MEYQIYVTKCYDEKWRMGIRINREYYTRIDDFSYKLVYLKILDNNRDFIKEMKKYTKRQNLTFNTEEKMNEAKEYIDSLLTMAKFVL